MDIKALRNSLELSPEDFAEKVGVTTRTIFRWESGKHKPKSKIIIKKLERLNKSVGGK